MKRLFFAFVLLPAASWLHAGGLPDWFLPLRDAIYEQQLQASEVAPLFRATKAKAEEALSGAQEFIILSRCEYMMGRAFQFEEQKKEAGMHYAEGIRYAEKALELGESAEAWAILADNISQNCAVRPVSYALANGLNVEKYAKNALALNSRNAAAQYMIAARWVFAPAPFHNHKKGIAMMEAILTGGDMDRDDRFNVHLAIGYAYIQQKEYANARLWLLKSLEVYPTNKYARRLLEQN